MITQVQVDARTTRRCSDPTKFIGQALSQERADELRRGRACGEAGRQREMRGAWSAARCRRPSTSCRDQAARRAGHDRHRVRRWRSPDLSTIALQGWEGIDAVVDKDLAAAVLARDLGARAAAHPDGRRRGLRRLGHAAAASAAPAHGRRGGGDGRAGAFGEGSMAPKVRAAVDFVRRTGGRAVITMLESRRRPRCEAKQERPSQRRAREHPRVPGEGDPARATACRFRRARSRRRPRRPRRSRRRSASTVVVKAQVHAGGRGKAGGVKLAKTPDEAREKARDDPRHARSRGSRSRRCSSPRRRHRERGLRRHHPRPRDARSRCSW